VIFQNTEGIDTDAQHYSCRFNVIARALEVLKGIPWTVSSYNKAWRDCRLLGFISGDLNKDGDYDDPGEDEILSDAGIFQYLGIPLRVVPLKELGLPTMIDKEGNLRIAPTDIPLDPNKYWVSEKWLWKKGHFLQGDGTGKSPAIWDPIRGGSLTRQKGRIESLRVWEIVL
jgi:hypothetical protein